MFNKQKVVPDKLYRVDSDSLKEVKVLAEKSGELITDEIQDFNALIVNMSDVNPKGEKWGWYDNKEKAIEAKILEYKEYIEIAKKNLVKLNKLIKNNN